MCQLVRLPQLLHLVRRDVRVRRDLYMAEQGCSGLVHSGDAVLWRGALGWLIRWCGSTSPACGEWGEQDEQQHCYIATRRQAPRSVGGSGEVTDYMHWGTEEDPDGPAGYTVAVELYRLLATHSPAPSLAFIECAQEGCATRRPRPASCCDPKRNVPTHEGRAGEGWFAGERGCGVVIGLEVGPSRRMLKSISQPCPNPRDCEGGPTQRQDESPSCGSHGDTDDDYDGVSDQEETPMDNAGCEACSHDLDVGLSTDMDEGDADQADHRADNDRSRRRARRMLAVPVATSGAAQEPASGGRARSRVQSDVYKVERLLKRRSVGNGKMAREQFLVRWDGYGSDHDSWEDRVNILNPTLIQEFHRQEKSIRKAALLPTPAAARTNVCSTPGCALLKWHVGVCTGQAPVGSRRPDIHGRRYFNVSSDSLPASVLATSKAGVADATGARVEQTPAESVRKRREAAETHVKPTPAKRVRWGAHKRLACLECAGCKRAECGRCWACLDKPKFGGQNLKRQRCLERRCVLLSRPPAPPPQTSQPLPEPSVAEEMWVACDECGKWRRVAGRPEGDSFVCADNADRRFGSCDTAQELADAQIDELLGLSPRGKRCSICSEFGHTARTCKSAGSQSPARPQGEGEGGGGVDGVEEERQTQVRENKQIWPTLADPDDAGVTALEVSAEAAADLLRFMRAQWGPGGALQMPSRQKIYGYSTYGKTLEPHSSADQRAHTLLITNAWLDEVRRVVPAFLAIEQELARWVSERFGVTVELFFAHALRQSKHTLRSTGFGVHRDTEEHSFISHSVVVKLTPDEEGEHPSSMRVIGASRDFYYGPNAGASGCFLADLHHQSLPPRSEREHLKVAFFFRCARCAPSTPDSVCAMGPRVPLLPSPLLVPSRGLPVPGRPTKSSSGPISKGITRQVAKKVMAKIRCKDCGGCTRFFERVADCGACTNCRDKPKFGGKDTRRQTCERKQCEAPSWSRSAWTCSGFDAGAASGSDGCARAAGVDGVDGNEEVE